MPNECKFYYSILMENTEEYPEVGSKLVEPIKVEDREPLGKEPSFCCDNMKDAIERHVLYASGWKGKISVLMEDRNPGFLNIFYCPFCGANIVFYENLKLRGCKTTRTIDSRYYEECL